ncbi:RNA polymerase sigma factor RpoH [Candidatus Portiera aleyrodidarum]|uniref:RNA polymerase sigma factor RpoH n=1 Tax=Candidatus Portiera aleyrodidarum TaxID=91844 RepID=UPI0005DA4CF3|nr:RNA polymerase sigma factor RpoH [Candidatus Portiera aleyrodidarum]CEL12345.1 RNA polymerase sigma factor RpoH [Candidatus Portiera aleyrodidarum]
MIKIYPEKNINGYIQTVIGIPLLTAKEEHDLAIRLRKKGDLEAARCLVMSNLRFVVHIARSYSGYGLQQSDIIQEGNVGLMKAVKRFDPSHGVRLVSFAIHWIKAEIHEYVLRNWRIVKVATTKSQRKLFFNLRSAKKRFKWLNNDEIKAIANDLNVNPNVVREMEGRLSSNDSGFDNQIEDKENNNKYQNPSNYIEDSRFDPAILLEKYDFEKYAFRRLYVALNKLDERVRDILKQRWLNEQKATLHELADIYGVSAERIRQLEKSAIKKIKNYIKMSIKKNK